MFDGVRDILNDFHLGEKVLILQPFYVAGKVGVICDVEDTQPQRWIIKVDSDENIIVSLNVNEFQALSQDF